MSVGACVGGFVGVCVCAREGACVGVFLCVYVCMCAGV